MGVDWDRKGGELALKVAERLNAEGLETELRIVGCEPKTNRKLPSFVKELGFIDKQSQSGIDYLNRLISESHFLILPSLSECYGIVFCEANSFGTPCLSTNVGGIPTVIRNDINGRIFSLQTSEEEYANYILEHFIDYEQYLELAYSSFNKYKQRLNWPVAVQSMNKLLKRLL